MSHAFALGSVPIDMAARPPICWPAGVAIMSHGPGGAHSAAEAAAGAWRRRVRRLRQYIRDAWSPFGNGDTLERAILIGYRANFRHDEELAFAFDMVTAAAASVLGSPLTASWSARRLCRDRSCPLAEAVAAQPRRKCWRSRLVALSREMAY